MKKRGRTLLLVGMIVGFIAGFVILMTVFEDPQESPYPTYSTLHTNTYGAQAIFRILGEKGYSVEKSYYSPEKFSPRDSNITLVMLVPDYYCNNDERDSLYRWISRGNRVLYVPDRENTIFDAKGVVLQSQLDNIHFFDGTIRPERATPTPLLGPPDSIRFAEEVKETAIEDQMDFGPTPETRRFAYTFSCDSLPIVPLLTVEGKVVMATMPLGKGEVVMMSNPWMFTNGGLKEGDNLAFALSVFEMMGGKKQKVWFDEYFHGFQMDRVATPLNEPPVRALVVGLLLTFGLMVFSLRRRKARAVPVYVEPRRSIGEYVESMGRIFAKKNGEWYLFEDIVSRFKARLQQSLGLTSQGALYNRDTLRSLSSQKWGVEESKILLLLLDDLHATHPDSDKDRMVWLAGRMREFSLRNHLDRYGSKDNPR